MLSLPTRDEAIEILEKFETSSHVISHCENVTRIALRIANQLKMKGYSIDIKLVEIGALLHDIGRSQSHDIDHVAIGAKIAEEVGLPEKVIHIIERHVGAGIPDDEAKELGLPKGHYVPETLEEKVVAYADKLSVGCREEGIEFTINDFSKKLGEDHPSIQRLRELDLEIKTFLGK
jgi:uncharacterized protein